MGFKSGKASPCIFWHADRDIIVMVHGDDFISTGKGEDLQWMRKRIEKEYEISTEIIGPEIGDKKQAKVLNRTMTYTNNGIEYEPDPRHAEIIVKELGLEQCNTVLTPGISEEPEKKDDGEALKSEEAAKYKSVVARANYLAQDRPEIQFATKECAKAMSNPCKRDMNKIK
eukprot:10540854-Karenia_brevis.AAC.1